MKWRFRLRAARYGVTRARTRTADRKTVALSDLSDLSDACGWNPRADVVGEGLQTVVCPRKKKRSMVPQPFLCPHTVVASGSPASAQGASEA